MLHSCPSLVVCVGQELAESCPSYTGTSHKLNVWALKWAERQETTHSGRLVAAYIINDLKTGNDPSLPFKLKG
jgi:hypothetical protein